MEFWAMGRMIVAVAVDEGDTKSHRGWKGMARERYGVDGLLSVFGVRYMYLPLKEK